VAQIAVPIVAVIAAVGDSSVAVATARIAGITADTLLLAGLS
jgi:hypothetical protein